MVNFNSIIWEQIKRDVNLCIPTLLKSSYLYYHLDMGSPLTDSEFDYLCKYTLENWSHIDHRLKYLISEEDLKGGTLYALQDFEYPNGLKQQAILWASSNLKSYYQQKWSI